MDPTHTADVWRFTDVDSANAAAMVAYLDSVSSMAGDAKRATFIGQQIAPGMRVLDLGCGTGDDVRALAEIVGPQGEVVGTDSSAAMIAEAVRRGVPSNARIFQASAYELPCADGFFDACRAERVFQHLASPEKAATELRRVVKANGSVLLVDQDWETITVCGGRKELTRRIVSAFVDSMANGWAGRSHTQTLRHAGFRDISIVGGVTQMELGRAFALVLNSAVESAKAAGAVTDREAQEWLLSLLEAQQRGEFYYSVSAFIALARP